MADLFKEFQDELSYYGDNHLTSQSDLVEFLRFTQGIYGYIPRGNYSYICETFGVSEKLVENIIKVYPSLYSQSFEEEIVVCNGPNCSKNGSLKLLAFLEEHFGIKNGEVTKDGKYLLRTQKCFKQCGKGPNVKIGECIHNKNTIEKLKKLLIID